jgi:hypothetical protein
MVEGRGFIVTPSGCYLTSADGSILPHNYAKTSESTQFQTIHIPNANEQDILQNLRNRTTSSRIRQFTANLNDASDTAVDTINKTAKFTENMLYVLFASIMLITGSISTAIIYYTRCYRSVKICQYYLCQPHGNQTLSPGPSIQNFQYDHWPPDEIQFTHETKPNREINDTDSRRSIDFVKPPPIPPFMDELKHKFNPLQYTNEIPPPPIYAVPNPVKLKQITRQYAHNSAPSSPTHKIRTITTTEFLDKIIPIIEEKKDQQKKASAHSSPIQNDQEMSKHPHSQGH